MHAKFQRSLAVALTAATMISMTGCIFRHREPYVGDFAYEPYQNVNKKMPATVGLPFHADLVYETAHGKGDVRVANTYLATGSLPPGIILNMGDNSVGGVPTLAGDYASTIKLTGVTYSGKTFGDFTVFLRIVVSKAD